MSPRVPVGLTPVSSKPAPCRSFHVRRAAFADHSAMLALVGSLLLVLPLGCIGDVELDSGAWCKPEEVEVRACGICGQQHRQCQEDETFGAWQTCNDDCRVCAGLTRLPTWDDPVSGILQAPPCSCSGCHAECDSYLELQPWLDDGSLKQYTEGEHAIHGLEKTVVLCWIALGAPQISDDEAIGARQNVTTASAGISTSSWR